MKLQLDKINYFDHVMAYLSLALFYLLVLIIFDWATINTYFLSTRGIIDNWMYHTGMSMTVFWLSDYLKKKKFHANANNKSLIVYSILIFLYTLLIILFYDFTQTYLWTKSTEIFWKSMYIRTISSSLISIVYIIRNYGQIIQENTDLNLELKESLQKESEKATKAQMNMLKLQLDPHFMFNSLNTLVGLIDEDPQKAEDFTLELSRIYKYIVANLDRDTISLKAGMAFINNYCKLIEIRYPQEFLLEIEDGIVKTPEEKILPLSLQLLVENAIKHNQQEPGGGGEEGREHFQLLQHEFRTGSGGKDIRSRRSATPFLRLCGNQVRHEQEASRQSEPPHQEQENFRTGL